MSPRRADDRAFEELNAKTNGDAVAMRTSDYDWESNVPGACHTVNGILVIMLTSGPSAGKTLKAIQPLLNNGEVSDSMAFGFGDYDADEPLDLQEAMRGKGGARVHILH